MEQIIPNLGMLCSQAGNALLPRWEYNVPSKGITYLVAGSSFISVV